MAARNKRAAEEEANKAIVKWAAGFASVAWIPGSHYAMAPGDIAMVMQLGSIFDVPLDRETAGVVFSSVAAPIIGSKVAHSILDFVPVVGWAAKSVIAGSVTWGVGKAMISYFRSCSKLPD